MESLDDAQQTVLKALAASYYDVVPQSLKTYCSITSEISAKVLGHFGIACELLPCQLMYAGPGRNYAIGFTGQHAPRDGVWDGHVICVASNWFIDAALHHLKRDFDVNVPSLAIGRRFVVPTSAIARVDITERERLWWLSPPNDVPAIPANPPAVVDANVAALIERMSMGQPA